MMNKLIYKLVNFGIATIIVFGILLMFSAIALLLAEMFGNL
jgi:hypothetical protein